MLAQWAASESSDSMGGYTPDTLAPEALHVNGISNSGRILVRRSAVAVFEVGGRGKEGKRLDSDWQKCKKKTNWSRDH